MFGHLLRDRTKHEAQARRENIENHAKAFEFCLMHREDLQRIHREGPKPNDAKDAHIVKMAVIYCLWELRWHEKIEETWD